jgi:hypothetical protein
VEIGAYKVETARLVLETVKYLRESGFIIERPGRGQQKFRPADAPIYIRNDTDEIIPSFACLQVTGAVDTGGQNYITVDKPVDDTGASGKYLFNGIAPIEVGGYGIAYDGPLVRMLTDGSPVTSGDMWKPVVNSFLVSPGGSSFSAIGLDDIETDVMRAFILSGGGGGASIEGTLVSLATAGVSSPYAGLVIGTITVVTAPCDRPDLIGTSVEVVDHSGCIFDLAIEDLSGVWVWAAERIAESLANDAEEGELTPCHWAANDRCCVAADTGA